MTTTVKIDTKEVERAFKKLGQAAEQVVEDAARAGGGVLKTAADVKAPGPHIVMDVTDKGPGHVEVSVGPDEEHWYYRFSEFGADPHTITAQSGGRLAFEGRQGAVVTPSVHHPGMAAKPFLRPAFDGHKDEAVKAVGETFKKALTS